jgi:enoyl-CoA hydratase/carnithine racemase
MRFSDYKCFQFGFDSGVAFVSIDHPPINLLDEALSQEFDQLGRELEADAGVRVDAVTSAIRPHGACNRTCRSTLPLRPHW